MVNDEAYFSNCLQISHHLLLIFCYLILTTYYLQLITYNLLLLTHHSSFIIHHSVLKLFTGFCIAALTVLTLIVIKAISNAATATRANIHQLIVIR